MLWISHFPVFGGPHNLALRLAGPLARMGVETTFLLPSEPGSAAPRLRDGGVEVIETPLNRLRASADPRVHLAAAAGLWPQVRRLRRLIAERRVDVVTLTGLANPHGALAARGAGAPVAWQILDSRTPAPLRAAMMPAVRRLADSVLFNGRALIDLHAGGSDLPAPTFVFAGVADSERLRPDRGVGQGTRARLGVPADALFAGTVANLNPQKGIEWFVRAAGRIHAERPDAWFLISGQGYATHHRYRRRLEREIARSPVPEERFVLTEDPPEDQYPALDVKLITSVPRSEGTTTTAVEAMACAVPVVATDVGAISEVVEDGVTGLLAPPLDPDALAAATLRLAADPELRMRLGEEGRRRVEERYDVGVIAAVFAEAFAAARSRFRSRRTRRRRRAPEA